MPFNVSARFGLIVRVILYGLCALLLAGFLFAWSGVYSIAASRGHWPITEWLLTFGMRNSVKTHAYGIDVPRLDNPDLVTLGAGHFHSGCAPCHGAPGVPAEVVAQGMLPPPPNLAVHMREWRDRELFWIIKNGIKYTGMPAWPSQQRGDEVWTLTAFLRRLPTLDAEGYQHLALGRTRQGREAAGAERAPVVVSTCARCHGADRDMPASGLVPILHGQPVEFLKGALQAYAAGQRASGIMQPVASDLARGDVERLAQYYASLPTPPRADPAGSDAAAVERGQRLAEQGDPAARVPACMSCHDAQALQTYPRLPGQNAAYMINRLRLWREGLPPGTASEAIMAAIARTLSAQQIADVSLYFSGLPVAPSTDTPAR